MTATTNGFDLGTAWVQIAPSMRGVNKAIIAELGGIDMARVGAMMGASLGKSVQGSLRDALKTASTASSKAALQGHAEGLKNVAAAESVQARAMQAHQAAVTKLTGAQQALVNVRATSVGNADRIAKAEANVASAAQAAAAANMRVGGAIDGVTAARTAAEKASGAYTKALAVEGTRMGQLGAQLPVLGAHMQSAGAATSTFGQKMTGVGSGMTAAITTPVLGATAAVGGLVAALGFKRLVGIDTAMGQFKGLGFEAEAVMQQVDAGVTGTSLSMAQGASMAVGILATGSVPLAGLEDQIKRVANISAAYNVDSEQAAYLMNNVLTKNKVTWGDLSQMQMNQIPVVTALADHYGVTGEAIQDMATRGEISIDDLNAALDSKAGAAAEAYATTWRGITANIMANLGRIGAAMMGPSFDILKAKAAELLAFLKSEDLSTWATDVGVQIGAVTATIAGFVSSAINAWNGLSPTMQKTIGIIAGVATAVGPVLLVIGQIVSTVGGAMTALGGLFASTGGAIAGASAGAATGGSAILGRLAGLAGPVGMVLSLVSALVAASPDLQQALGGAFQSIMGVVGDLLGVLGPLLGDLLSSLTPILKMLGDLVAQALVALSPLIEMLGVILAPAIALLAAILEPIIGILTAILTPTIQLASWVVSLIAPLIELAAAFLGIGVQWLADMLTTLLVPAFEWLGDVIGAASDWLMSLSDGSSEASQGLQGAWSGAVAFFQGVWDGIVQAFTWAWGTFIQPIIDAIAWVIGNVLVPAFQTIWTVASFVWSAISVATQIWWGVISFVFNAIVTAVSSFLAPIFTWLYETIILPAWIGIRMAIDAVYNWFMTTLVPAFNQALAVIGSAFEGFRDTVSAVWEAVKQAAMAPVKFVVQTVYQDGIKALFDDIAEAVGLDIRMPDAPSLAFASGGVLPGYTPGRDVHQFYSPTGGRLALSGGEGIIRPDSLRALGGKAWLDAVNGARSSAGQYAFADGGIWDAVGGTFAGAGEWLASVAGAVAQIVADPMGAIDRMILEPVKGLLGSIGGGQFGSMLSEMPLKWVEGIKTWFSSLIKPTSSGAVGNWQGGQTLARLMPYIQQFGLMITDTYRDPAYNAAVGGSPTSYHMDAANPAVDVAGSESAMWAFYNAILGDKGGWRQILWQVAGHLDHVHVADQGGVYGQLPTRKYDSGGMLQPGLTLAYNGTGKPEPIRTHEQEAALQRRLGAGDLDGTRLRLVVDGHEFDAYVDARSAGVVAGAHERGYI